MSRFNMYSKQIVLETPLNRGEVIQKIEENTAYYDLKKFNFSIPSTNKEFLGIMTTDGFYGLRNLKYISHSWRPIITIKIEDNLNGSKLTASFRVHTFVQIFSYIWLTPLALLAVYSVFLSLFDWYNIFMAIFSILFGSLMLVTSLGGFNYEVKKAIKILIRLLNARQIIVG